jgi:hypothetical protein
MKYTVRTGFVLHKQLGTSTQPFPEGSEVELSDKELPLYILQVEEIKEEVKPNAKV